MAACGSHVNLASQGDRPEIRRSNGLRAHCLFQRLLGMAALAGCGGVGTTLSAVPKDTCQQILDTVKTKADLPPRAESQYVGQWSIVLNNKVGEGAMHRIVTRNGKVVLQALANAEPHMTSMDQQGVLMEWIGSSDEQGLYLYTRGDRRVPLWLRYSTGNLEGTMTTETCEGTEFHFLR